MSSIFNTVLSPEAEAMRDELKLVRTQWKKHMGGAHRLLEHYRALKQADVDAVSRGEEPALPESDWDLADQTMQSIFEGGDDTVTTLNEAYTAASVSFVNMTPTPEPEANNDG